MKTRTYLLMMLASIIVPVACLCFFGLYWLLQSERESRIRSIEEMANSTALMIDSEIAAAESALRNVANSERIRTDDFARLHRLLTATRQTPLSWSMIADYEGNGLMNTLVPYGTQLTRNSGKWATGIYDSQKTKVSGYFIGTRSKRGVVSVNVPVPKAVGKKYVVTQIFDPRYFNKVFPANAAKDNWIVGVFDANGISIARNVNAEKFVGGTVRPEIYEASRKQKRGIVRNPTRDGVDVYNIFVRSDVTNWTVAIGVPVDQIESAARMTTLYAALALAAVLSAAIGIAVFFGQRIDRSIRDATSAAQALAQGDVAPASYSRLKEVNTLLDVLHRTSMALTQESQSRLVLEHEREGLLDSERTARKRAEAESNAKDNFTSMLSHELRNPLAAIISAVSVIRLPQMPPLQSARAWDIVERQLAHLTRMLEELLDVRRVLSGKVTLQTSPINMRELLQFSFDSKVVGGKDTHQWSISTKDAWVLGDPTRLRQVIDNLLSNAVKYTPAGGRIAISNFIDDDTVVVEVADTGAGVAADLLPTIFQSLVQGPTTIDRSQGGLGLGLSIAQGLVHMHGGTITAYSEGIGMGSTFTVRLPVYKEITDASASSKAQVS